MKKIPPRPAPAIGPAALLLAALILCLLPTRFAGASDDTAGRLRPCTACHTAQRICANLDRGPEFWTPTVAKMLDKGARIAPEDVSSVVRILATADEEVGVVLGCAPRGAAPPPPVRDSAGWIVLRLLHPALMTLAFCLALWVGWQGLNRARASHLKKPFVFNWKGHVKAGLLVMALWCLGMGAGSAVTWLVTGAVGVTGTHRSVAMAMLPLILFAAGSGLYMDKVKKKRLLLPVLHGLLNLLLLVLSLSQLITGMAMVSRLF